jgi:hypothetical protein
MVKGALSEISAKLHSPQPCSLSRFPELSFSDTSSGAIATNSSTVVHRFGDVTEKETVKPRKTSTSMVSQITGTGQEQERKQPGQHQRQYYHCKAIDRMTIPSESSSSSSISIDPSPQHQQSNQLGSSPTSTAQKVEADPPITHDGPKVAAHQTWHDYKKDDVERRMMIAKM